MDKRFIIERVRSDLRNDIYDLMTHVGYHALEKEMTESLLKTNKLYNDLRSFAAVRSIPWEEKNARKELFAYHLYREMNARLGGFHFDRFKSLSSGQAELQLLNEMLVCLDFEAFNAGIDAYQFYRAEPDFGGFQQSRQFRLLESLIASAIKKNKVVPGVARAIAQDVVDALRLDEEYTYIRIDPSLREKHFELPDDENTHYLSLRKIPFVCDGQEWRVLLKRESRNSDTFRFLLTDFGALIRGNPSAAQ